jgi:hypothetical protein
MLISVTPVRRRFLATAGLVVTTVFLAGCTLTATGTGTVTVTSDPPANAYDPVTEEGSIAYVCAASATQCEETDPYLYTYRPADGASEWIVSPGFPVLDRANQAVGLPAGRYRVQVTDYTPFASRSNSIVIDVFNVSEKDLTIWHQSHGREESGSPCEEGWQPSWAQWPNEGMGGFVCDRRVYAYYPDEPVK